MRTAETVLGVIWERGKRGLPLQDVYRQLYNPDLYLVAYARLYSNKGATTPGTTGETVDGMSLTKIQRLIDDLRHERYRWTPVRRTYIPKKNGKLRPLGIPTWSDKLLQEVIRLILEAYYEPQMSDHSHGFRPDRGCHTALNEVTNTWTGTKWFIEGDISRCFDQIDHTVLLSILREKIHDNRFLRLIANLLSAGYLEEWRYNKTLSGTPQGGVCSPVLANIYLDKLDKYVEGTLLPAFNRGKIRRNNNRYFALTGQIVRRRKQGKRAEVKALCKQRRRLPARDPQDPNYRRLRYVRYADDFILGFAGTKAEAEEIKNQLRTFLREHLRLELSREKTLITHAETQAAHFLGYEIVSYHEDTKLDHTGRRSINGKVELRLPAEVVEKKAAFYMRHGKPRHRAEMLQDSDFSIISCYQSEYRGLVQYYLLAQNVSWLAKLHWVMSGSLLKTLAGKHKATVKQTKRRLRSVVTTPYGPMKCLELQQERANGKPPLIARFGGIPLRQQPMAVLEDRAPTPFRTDRNELTKRLLASECELCGERGDCEVHHIRKLADLKRKGRKEQPAWVQFMTTRKRKTLVVCRDRHEAIHAGRQTRPRQPEADRRRAG